MELITTRVPLGFGLVAVLLSDDSDRPVYVPPPVKDYEHDDRCGCARCVSARATRR